MHIEDIYEDFKVLNDQYIEFINNLVESDFVNNSETEILDKLTEDKILFETLKVKGDSIEVTKENKENIMDLKYLIVDGLFLSIDLLNFYKNKEIERFKMRTVNYIRKKRVLDTF